VKKVAILGAGISGLSAGYFLNNAGIEFKILEKQETYGGLARSFVWHGHYCDFAAHRFFTTSNEVESILLDLVPMVHHTRKSHLFIKGNWVNDPINPIELLQFIPFKEKIQLIYELLIKENPVKTDNFRDFVINKHGEYMFHAFFKPYTEKLFGIKSEKISVLWAKNKVRLINPFKNINKRSKKYFSYFYYPIDKGYGLIADMLYDKISEHVLLNSPVHSLLRENGEIVGVQYEENGDLKQYYCDAVISTLPLTLTARLLNLEFNQSFRKVEAVYLLINKPKVSENHWVYFIDDAIAVNRLVEFKNLSPINRPDDTSVLCAEVTKDVDDPVEKVSEDLIKVGMITRDEILDTKVIRKEHGYPVYHVGYENELSSAMDSIDQEGNFYILGRSAEFIHREVDDIIASSKLLSEKILAKWDIKADVIPVQRERMKRSCIVILTYNNVGDTIECINSLLKLKGGPYKIFLVDNGSSDGTLDIIGEMYPEIEILSLKKNLGVPSGFNQGIYHALSENYEHIFMVNNDTVVDPDMMVRLLEVSGSDHDCGIVMPKIYYYPPHEGAAPRDKVWSDGGYFRNFPPAIKLKDNRTDINFDEVRKIEYAPTCALLIHRRAFESVGLFDPGYFFFFEDWDFSERVRSAGLNIWCAPEAKLWHKVSSSTKKDMSVYWHMMGESGMRFFRRHTGFVSYSIQIAYFILRDFIFKFKNFKYLNHYLRGLRDGYSQNLGDFPDISNLMISKNYEDFSK